MNVIKFIRHYLFGAKTANGQSTSHNLEANLPMSQFTHGHALSIGVGADLPVTVDDATAIATILKDPERCAYPSAQVTLLTEASATRQSILNALDQLAAATTPESSIVLYFSGHGYQITTITGAAYFLMPYGCDIGALPTTAISGPELMQKLDAIPAQKMLILFDCCHAGGMDNAKAAGAQLAKAPLPAEAAELLVTGEGRVIIASCRADEESFTGNPFSEFTNALVAAFVGEGVSEKDGYVRAADLAMYAREVVPQFTRGSQHPVLHFEQADNFAIAYYAAGGMEPKGLPKPMQRQDLPERAVPDATYSATNSGSGAIAQCTNAVAAGERGFAAGGDVTDSTIITGEGNKVDQSTSAFNQSGQTVHGNQTNIDGDVSTDGGLLNFGSINTGGGEVIARDKIVHGDEVHGDKVEEDKVMGNKTEGDHISATIGDGNSNIAVGKDITQTVTTTSGIDPTQLNELFASMLTAAAAAPEKQFEAVQAVTELKAEVGKGEQANDKTMAKLIEGFVDLVPTGVSAVISAFASPILGGIAGPATEYVLEKIQG